MESFGTCEERMDVIKDQTLTIAAIVKTMAGTAKRATSHQVNQT
jgi:hypothetical protein